MTGFKNLLVGMAPDARLPSAALDYALDLAERFGAHLSVEVGSSDDMPVGQMNYEAASMVEQVNDRLAIAADSVADRVRFVTDLSGVPCSIRTTRETFYALRHGFAAVARTHDLAILGDDQADAAYAETALYESGRPVMIVPAGTAACRLGRCAIAWDSSATAARAVNDALPLLAAFDAVELVCVRQATQLRDQLPGFEITQHLNRHGIDAVLHEVPVHRDDSIDTLLDYLGRSRFDLVVMGAYSHSFLRERLFGGTTRSMLNSPPTTLFLSHS